MPVSFKPAADAEYGEEIKRIKIKNEINVVTAAVVSPG